MICSVEHIDREKYVFLPEKAERIINFFEKNLIHVRGEKAGEPFLLEDWQKYHLSQVFGWYDAETKTRRKHRFFYWEIAKGNGKSAIESGIVLYMCAAEGLTRGENYCVAGDRFQARIVFDACAQMVNDNPKIKDLFELYKNSIIHRKTQSVIHVISAESAGKHGFRPYCIAFDEVHVQKNRDLYDTLTKGLIKTPNSLCAMITTAGNQNTFADEIHTTARQIAQGIIENESWYVAIYAADKKDDPFSEETIKKANPGYGTIIKAEDFKLVVDDAKAQVSGLNSYLRLHLNIWTGSLNAWIPLHEFDRCNLGVIDLERLAADRVECWGGLDLASNRDLTSFSLMFEDGDILHWAAWFWCPSDTIRDREKNENVSYRVWAEQGHVFATPGNVQDTDYITAFVTEACHKYNVQEVAFDPAKFRTDAAKLVENHDLPMIEFPQQMQYFSEPTKGFEKAVLGQSVNHAGNPVLRWQMDNAETWSDNNDNIRVVKGGGRLRSNRGTDRKKVDGIISGIMAYARYMNAKISRSSVYDKEREGFLTL